MGERYILYFELPGQTFYIKEDGEVSLNGKVILFDAEWAEDIRKGLGITVPDESLCNKGVE